MNELGGINLYEFVRNRPTCRRDSFGLIGVPGSTDCDGLLQQIEDLQKKIADAVAEGQDDPGMYVTMAELQAQYERDCTDPAPPMFDPAPRLCPIRIRPLPPNPYQNNRTSFCSRHPILCVGVGTGIGVGIGCVLAPEACAITIRIGIGVLRGAAPVAAAGG